MGKHRIGLLRNTLTWFVICMIALMLLATPLFYWLTKSFYAEDLIDLIEAVQRGQSIPRLDLEEDIIQGVMIQFGIITVVSGIAVVLTISLISKRVWRPFYNTLEAVESFRLESGVLPSLQESRIKEFSDLNTALSHLMTGCIKSFRVQKEFTENASHELQTPLAVFRSKLDILSQLPELTERQATIIQDLNQINNRMSRLNRNLLLLAKMENSQFDGTGLVDVVDVVKDMPYIESLLDGLTLHTDFSVGTLQVRANRPLLEILFSNLIVNAVRHNKPQGEILVKVTPESLIVANTSYEKALDRNKIFERFYRPTQDSKGCGLGLSIVKAVCNYHGWKAGYSYKKEGWHEFKITFI